MSYALFARSRCCKTGSRGARGAENPAIRSLVADAAGPEQSKNNPKFYTALLPPLCSHCAYTGLGIDVCAVHPSPVASNFYDKVDHKIEMMEAAQKSAVDPEELPRSIFKCIPNAYLYDIGEMAVGTRLGTWFLPFNFFTMCFAKAAPFLPDYKKHNGVRVGKVGKSE